jgi:hypothetical protein
MVLAQTQNNNIWKSIDSLFEWVRKNRYIGWDPYDGLNSIQIQKLCTDSYFLEMGFTQLNVYSIVNLRSLLQIKKGRDIKGTALFAQTYSNLFQLTGKKIFKNELEECISFLKETSLKKIYKFDCWSSHYFPYLSIGKIKLIPGSPDIIGTSRVIIALTQSSTILKDNKLKEVINNAALFLIEKLLEKRNDDYFFKYHLLENEKIEVPNASAQGLECLSYVLSMKRNNYIKDICEKITESIIKNQSKDGSWAYSIKINGKERKQLDFHQGYILDGLFSFLPFASDKQKIINSLNKGVKFYKNTLFLKNGQSFYRYPMKYPIEIHNQAQGIITFSKLQNIDRNYLKYAEKIALWTIDHMQSKEGYFYCQKWPIITNKIPYMRWGQAWMMLALSILLREMEYGK